jgi:hypothetical protein
MLTKSKVLSNTGVEIGASKLNNVVTNNISITTKSDVAEEKVAEKVDEEKVEVDDEEKVVDTEKDFVNKKKAITFLKKIINLYANSNLLKIEGKLVLRNEDLIDVIKLIIETNYSDMHNTSVDIKVDYEINCCGTSKGINFISKILINGTHDMKYVYNEEYNTLMQYGISLKHTLD